MKFDIDKSFGIFAHFTPPLSRGLIALSHAVQRFRPRFPSSVGYKRVTAGGCPAVLVSPKGAEENLPCLIYFHGGGFVFRAGGYHFANAAQYCTGARCKVLFVDYPLAPKASLSRIASACLSAYGETIERAEEWGIDLSRIAVGGDSAGGFLAADVIFRARAQKLSLPCFAMLIYPVLDRRMVTPSMKEFTDTPMWNARLNKIMWTYCRPDFPSPAEAEDVSFFPPAYIETAQFDCLKDEGENFAARLKEQGVSVQYNATNGTMHGFDIARKSPITRAAVAARTAALKRAFYPSK